jgi:hypothetical protein
VKRSSRPVRTVVKANGGVARHLEGWQPGFLAILVAGVSALLAVPRSVPPTELPEPMIEPRELDRVAQADAALADAAERERLDTDVRAVGSAIIAYNLAEVAGDAVGVARERRAVAEAARRALPQGEEALARLRAHHLRSFQRELRRWETTGEETDTLRELGGLFLENARADRWIEGRRLLADETVRGALFKKRWSELSLVRGALEISIVEQRAVLRFLLLHPHHEGGALAAGAETTRAGEQRAEYLAEHYRLKKIEEIRALDPGYPADFGRGVVLYRLHSYPQSVEAFRLHLEAHPDGPYTLRAQNYLRAALGAAMETL